jgi:putative hydrolase of HD superfamily
MQPRQLIDFLSIIEKLKCNTRHSWTSNGRQESVAEHSWRLAVMAMLVADEFPEADVNKVIKMCLVHDFGEAITGDIPSFNKTEQHEREEDLAVKELLSRLPEGAASELTTLFAEMNGLSTLEAKLFKALDNMEVLISHNEAPLDTWIPLEFTLNFSYGAENVAFSEYMKKLKEEINADAKRKMDEANHCVGL